MFQIHEYPINAFLEALRAEYKRQGHAVEFWPFHYNAEARPVNASSSLNAVNTADQDSDFAIVSTQMVGYTTGGVYTSTPNVSLVITYDVSGRGIQDRPTHSLCMTGRGMRPFYWPRPLVIRAKGSWTTTFNNLDTATNFNLFLTYSGVKIFKLPPRG